MKGANRFSRVLSCVALIVLVAVSFGQVSPGGGGGTGGGRDSNPANPLNWTITKSLSGTYNQTNYVAVNGVLTAVVQTLNEATNTWTPALPPGQTYQMDSAAPAGKTASLNYDVTYTFTITWVGVGAAPSHAYVELSTAATIDGATSPSLNDGLQNSPLGEGYVGDWTNRRVDTSNSGSGTITIEITGSGSAESATSSEFITGSPEATCFISPRAAKVFSSEDQTFHSGYSPIPNDMSPVDPAFGDTACSIGLAGGATALAFTVGLWGDWPVYLGGSMLQVYSYPLYRWSTMGGVVLTNPPSGSGIAIADLYTIQDLIGMVSGIPKVYTAKCEVDDPLGADPSPRTTSYQMRVHTPIEKPIATYESGQLTTPGPVIAQGYNQGGTLPSELSATLNASITLQSATTTGISGPLLEALVGSLGLTFSVTVQAGVELGQTFYIDPGNIGNIRLDYLSKDYQIHLDTYGEHGWTGVTSVGLVVPMSPGYQLTFSQWRP